MRFAAIGLLIAFMLAETTGVADACSCTFNGGLAAHLLGGGAYSWNGRTWVLAAGADQFVVPAHRRRPSPALLPSRPVVNLVSHRPAGTDLHETACRQYPNLCHTP